MWKNRPHLSKLAARAAGSDITPLPKNRVHPMTSFLPRGIILTTVLALAGTCAFAADSKPKTKVLIDFTKQDVEMENGVPKPIRKYDYSFETWSNKLVFLEGKGVLIPLLPGKGGMGKDDRLGIGANAVSCTFEYAILPRNESESITVSMVDSDGTEVSWYIGLKDRPRGVPLSSTLDLTKPDKEDKPGKKPGFDKTKTKTWQIKGNWQDPKVELVLIRLSAVTP